MATRTTYKIVQVVDGCYFSVYDPQTEYVLGKRLAQKAVENHRRGYYSYPELEQLMTKFHDGTLFPEECYQLTMELAVLAGEISGAVVAYENGKIASTSLRPMKVIHEFRFVPLI